MKYFEHTRVESFDEASELLKDGKAAVIAGGSDLLGVIKNEILEESPQMLIDIKNIEGADAIKVEGDKIWIGALAKLSAIAKDEEVSAKAPALAEAAYSVATPLIRNLATIGGNICQDVRCWFYRYPHEAGDRMVCRRKGGDTCFAIQGDNRYHSVYGGMKCGGPTPCSKGCPAGTDIPGYMEQIRLGNPDGAAQILMQVNPMPCITSRVCAHFCQDHCNQPAGFEPVAIRNVERALGDYILAHKDRFYPTPAEETGKSIAIVGSGPSGLSAAFYLRKEGNAVTVYDSKERPGGMLLYAIPDYRLPKSIVDDYIEALKGMGIKFECGKKIGKDIQPAELEASYDSVYYATGTWKRPVLGLAGEELTVFGLDFLVEVEKWMNGKVGQEVLVTGGGNVAMDVAITAKRLGAKKVVLACLEPEDLMPAGREEVARTREEGVQVMPGWGPSKVLSDGGVLKGMELVRCTSVYNDHGHFAPQYDEAEKLEVKAENVLMAVGQKVDLSFLDERYQLQLNDRGLIDVEEETMMTSHEGVFAGGDVTTGPSTVIQCVANGHKAARGIGRYLQIPEDHACRGMQIQKPFLTNDPKGVLEKKALTLKELPVEERSLEKEDETAPTMEEAGKEAKRCMNCGCFAVEPSDITPVLVALGATIHTTRRQMSAQEFCCRKLKIGDVLAEGELVTKIEVPVLEGAVMHYDKFRLREAVDWAIVSLASAFAKEDGKLTAAKLVLGGAAPVPVELNEVQSYLMGKTPDAETAAKAGELAVKECNAMWRNGYKVHEVKVLVEKAVLRMQG